VLTQRELCDDGVLIRAHRNEAPVPPPEHVVAALRSIEASLLGRYPDALQRSASAALAARLRVDPSGIVLGNGADDMLYALTNAFVSAGDNALVVTPSFSTYARAVAVAGGELRTLRYRERWSLDSDALVASADDRTRLIVLGHPNNPTNEPLDRITLERIARLVPQALIVVDEVYLSFSEHSLVSAARDVTNVAVLGSLSKVGALAGLRIGYAIANRSNATVIRRVMPPFPVGVPSLVAAEAYARGGASTDRFEAQLAKQVERSLDAIVDAIRPRAHMIWRGSSNFVLADFGEAAESIERSLAVRGIAARAFTDPDLGGCLRFCALDDAATAQLVEALNA
jgi:histidinol-phosphate aminotransferase